MDDVWAIQETESRQQYFDPIVSAKTGMDHSIYNVHQDIYPLKYPHTTAEPEGWPSRGAQVDTNIDPIQSKHAGSHDPPLSMLLYASREREWRMDPHHRFQCVCHQKGDYLLQRILVLKEGSGHS